MWINRSRSGPGQVLWKTGMKQPELQRPPYRHDMPLHEEIYDEWTKHLVVGALWHTRYELCEEPHVTVFAPHELSYLTMKDSYMSTRRSIPVKSPSIYMGTTRVEETNTRGAVVRVLRHVFLVGGRRYMTRSLQDFMPASVAAL